MSGYWSSPSRPPGSQVKLAGVWRPRGNRVNAFDILIAGIAGAHHARVIVTADADFHEIAKYSGIEIWDYQRQGAMRPDGDI